MTKPAFFTLKSFFHLLPLLALLLIVSPTLVHAVAQTPPADESYWRFSAARQLTHVIPADVNGDGVLELLLAAENGTIDLLNANNADRIWSYGADGLVQALQAVNVLDGDPSPLEIALVVNEQLVLLDDQGIELWRVPLSTANAASPADSQAEFMTHQLVPYDADGNGRDELLILFNTGELHLYDSSGNLLRRINSPAPTQTAPAAETRPIMQTGDLNQDGRDEIVLGLFNPQKRFSELFLFDADGNPLWQDAAPISGHITAITLAPFAIGGQPAIAVGTDRGEIYLYDDGRQRLWWPRTLNRPITALAVAPLAEGSALIVGTDAGMLVAYSADGRRYWTRRLTTNAERSIIGLSTTSFVPETRNPVLAAVLGPDIVAGGNQLVKLIDTDGLDVDSYEAGEGSNSLTYLLDMNGDQRSELVLTRFATVELQGLGLGVSETAKEWDYLLDAEPGAILVVDFNNDGRDELLLGAQNGKLHYLVNGNNLEWKHAPGGAITQLALLERAGFAEPTFAIVVGRNNSNPEPQEPPESQSWVELRQTNGERIWEFPLAAPITDLLVEDTDDLGDPEIIVSTADGLITLLDATGDLVWQTQIPPATGNSEPETIQKLLHIETPSGDPLLVAITASHLYLTPVGTTLPPRLTATFDSAPVKELFHLNQPGVELANRLLLFNDQVRGFNWRTVPLAGWPLNLGGQPQVVVPANGSVQESFEPNSAELFLVSTSNDDLLQLSIQENKPELLWTLPDMPGLTALYWGDLDGNRLPEFAAGDGAGKVQLFTNVPPAPKYLDELSLTSGVFAITALRRGEANRADLVVVTENGEVQLFSAKENHPPLLTNPATEVSPGQYGFNVSVMDVEEDEVRVRLEIQNPETGEWQLHRESTLSNGNGPLSWNVVDPPTAANGVHYRFNYDDGAHTGTITPPTGPQPMKATALSNSVATIPLLTGVTVLGGIALLFVARQTQTPTMRTRRFYWRLQQRPSETLVRLENWYISTNGSPDFLLTLSGLARQQNDELVSGLADGLFLLADRPQAGLPLIVGALEQASRAEPHWQQSERWLLIFRTGQELLAAPTLTELSLEWPQLQKLLDLLDKWGYWSPAFYALAPALTTIRDGGRVNRPEDQLVYLYEAAEQLTAVLQELPEVDTAVEKPLVQAIAQRWAGLVSAETEELEGRAELTITLKTRRIVPAAATQATASQVTATQVTFEIANNGRAPAENVIAVLDDDPAYTSSGQPEEISFLPPGHTRLLTFDIRPQVNDRFRVGLTVTFNDRNQNDKVVAFGDQVHLLLPRDFTPIPNPYRPGTPLRQNSSVFYGREWLFNFITENAGTWAQRNVLILIGQRRTGKTSALLNLELHLPHHLIPVYIDCQSLGVQPGMAALFHDWGWLIADTLATRNLNLEVPPIAAWEADPAGQFQRHFLPAVRALLPPESTLLLVFDEFEVFEHLVDDGILPPTFFNFLRHLMQHSEGLSFVFVGTRRLEEMSADYWSVMFNIALYQRITYLREETAMRLITEPVAPHLVYDDLALDKILRVTAGHPYFLQLVCYTLVQQANNQRKGYVTISDVNAALDEMLTLGEVHFAYLWQRSSFTEQAILTAVTHMPERSTAFRPEEFIQFLEPYGIHLQPKEVTTALNTLVEREIMQEVRDGATTQYELRLGLVGLWAAQYKSLSKLHALPVNGRSSNGKQKAKPSPATSDK